ncbi:formylmethanofuran dehydrogenase subunit C [Methylorubrum zatmanii]
MSTLRLRGEPQERVDLLSITPLTLKALTEAEAGKLAIGTSRRGLTLGDVFEISLDGSDSLVIEGGSSRLDRVGAALSEGSIRVEGDVGQRLGEGMAGGTLTVTGSAGPYAATGATGGTITIEGDAGDHAGGAVYAAKAGLDGATLVIKGRAGDHLGDRMRKGLILAESAGAFAASRMIAGTIVVSGALGDHPGYGMRRGTLIAGSHGALLPTFVETGTPDLVFTRLLAQTLKRLGASQVSLFGGTLRRYSGDLATLGKGELFVPA